MMAWPEGPTPDPKQVLRQELWLWGPNSRQVSEPVELLEIFIDKVKFVVILKSIQLLLGGWALAEDRASSLFLHTGVDLRLSTL